MRLNLAEHKRIYEDTGPYKNLDAGHLELLRDGDTTVSSISITAETMAIICELGSRYRLDELVYYRDAATTENIVIFGKQGPGNDFVWEELATLPAADKVTVDFTAAGTPGSVSFNAESAHFEQTSAQHASVADTEVFDVSAMTIECWIRPYDLPTTGAILGKLGADNGNFSFWLRTVNTTEIQVAFSVDGTSAGAFISQPHGITLLNTWHHVAATWDGSTGDVIIYVDGAALAAPVTLLTGTIYNSSSAFAVGRLGDHPELAFGDISEVRIWDVVRTPTEIQDNMFSIASGSESGILAAYHLDGNFDDAGPNGLHLTAVNDPAFTTNIPWGGQVAGHFKQLKILHTVTAGTASVYELELWTDDNHVQFGALGETTVFSVDSGTNTLLPEPVQIYNVETVSADVYCVIDSETTDAYGLSLGIADTGPFYGIYSLGISLPTDIPWANGQLNNVVASGVNLVLVSGTNGSYVTPVIDIDTVEGRRLFWVATLTGVNVIDDPTREDSVHTVGVRFSDTMPTDGGWTTGQLSVDGLWSIASGTLPFESYDNNHIINPTYKRYMQAEIGFVSPLHGETPVLEKFGVEQGQKLVVPAGGFSNVYAKSQYNDHAPGRTTGIIVWSPEHRNKDQ
jgi:hypothetical protein